MSNFITLDEWREFDEVVPKVRLFLKRLGHDIILVPCEECDYSDECGGNHLKRKVICLDTEEVFDSLSKAAKSARTKNGAAISRVCKGERSNYRGRRYAYYDDYVAGTIPKYKGAYEKETCQPLWR